LYGGNELLPPISTDDVLDRSARPPRPFAAWPFTATGVLPPPPCPLLVTVAVRGVHDRIRAAGAFFFRTAAKRKVLGVDPHCMRFITLGFMAAPSSEPSGSATHASPFCRSCSCHDRPAPKHPARNARTISSFRRCAMLLSVGSVSVDRGGGGNELERPGRGGGAPPPPPPPLPRSDREKKGEMAVHGEKGSDRSANLDADFVDSIPSQHNRRGDFSPFVRCGGPLRSKTRRPRPPRAAARVVPPATGVASHQQLLRAVPSFSRCLLAIARSAEARELIHWSPALHQGSSPL
jgi:hypothetical protein